MGCTASKLDNEDTVRLCRERRRLIKDAVFARHHLAAAHSDYCRSLRLTGSALCAFAAGQHLSVSDNTPAVFLPTATPDHPPPPPPFSPSPSPTIASSKLPHILSSSSIGSSHRRRKPPPPKLPHILSESSPSSSSPRSQASNFPPAKSTYSSTPSQDSSAWNWENFYPPSPPGSEYFKNRAQQTQQSQKSNRENPFYPNHHHHLDDSDNDGERSEISEYNIFHQNPEPPPPPQIERSEYNFRDSNPQFIHHPQKHHYETEYTETEREEVQCSDWGDHYSTTSSSGEEVKDADSKSVAGGKVEKFDEAGSTASYRTGDVMDMRMVVRHKDLKEIVEAIRDNFDKAASTGDKVSEMLEISKAQLDRSFSQLRKTVYHSSGILSNLSSSWTSKPPLAVKYRLDTGSLEEPGGPKSLCSTLERLLAWEKKLYQEVKARENVKIEHQKKLSALQSQEYKGDDEAKLDKTKASITRLQSLIIVTSQAVSTTSTAIIGLRDSGLVPQLVELCHGIMYMWKSMHQYHEIQSNIVQQVRGLVNRSPGGDSTSELHRQATRDLESSVSAWHTGFCRLVKFQRDFIVSLHGWFKLSLIPVNNEHINKEPSDVYAFIDEWKLSLDRVPDTVASEAIKSFINVIHVISVKQSEELKIKKRTEIASKELEKKASALRNIERKFYNSYSMVGIGLPDPALDNGPGLDARDPLAEKKTELAACQRRVEDEMLKHAKAVEVTRAMTLNNLQTGLPGVFQALTSFSTLFTEALESVCRRSYAIK